MAIVRRVLDLSHHNSVSNLQTVKDAGIWGIIHKATEGTGFIDSKYAGRKKGFLELGFLWGAYHFFHPGNVQAQVDFFLRVAGVDEHTLYALDWEQSSSGTANEQQAVQFLQALEAATGRKGAVYSGNVAKEQIHGVNTYLGSHRLWLAQYSSHPSTQASWHNNIWLWQYSDGQVGPQPHGCPGVSGYVDTNSWTDSQEKLTAEWSGKAVVPVPPEPVAPVHTFTISSSVPVVISVVAGDNVTLSVDVVPPVPSIQANHSDITATVFQDSETAYPPFDGITDTELSVSLPANVISETQRTKGVRVYNRIANLSAVGQVRDKGPWVVNDDAYVFGTSPSIAATCYDEKTPLPSGPNAGQVPTNDAAIDLSPGMARVVAIDGKGKVDWEFV